MTLLVAVIAALYARSAVREAKETREGQSRPYVVAYLVADGFLIDLVVKNFGMTPARTFA